MTAFEPYFLNINLCIRGLKNGPKKFFKLLPEFVKLKYIFSSMKQNFTNSGTQGQTHKQTLSSNLLPMTSYAFLWMPIDP